MDNSQQQYQNGMSNHNSNYQPLPLISPSQLQQNQTTLPPLQNSQGVMMYQHSAPHTPRTPGTPNTPGSANTMGGFPQMRQGQGQGYPMMQNQYPPPPQQQQQQQQPYRPAGSMMGPAGAAMNHPQAIAPAPNRMGHQPLRPMPAAGPMHMGNMQYGQGGMMLQEMEQPTHVVGSQGRRGILPSAPGRPAASATSAGKNAMIPAKDADGKFPCPHCTKTYLHAKHLKRHLLRHTGDRPYMCVLCRDTFSRSDILKRHFQKCSIRRGNPTGASHLSHAQSHLKKSHPGPHKSSNSMSNENDMMNPNGMNPNGMNPNGMIPNGMNPNGMNPNGMNPNGMNQNGMNQNNGIPLFGVVPDGSMPDASSNLTDEQAEQLSRSNSLKRLSAGGGNGQRMTGPGPAGSNRSSFDQQNFSGIASSMPSGMNPSLAFSMPLGQNGHSYNQGYDYSSHGTAANAPSNGQDWSHMFQPTAQDSYIAPYNQNINNSQVSIKTEPSTSNNGLYTPGYPGVPNGLNNNNNSSNFPTWNLQNDPLEEISNRLIYFCYPSNQIIGRSNDIRKYLTAQNIKHFLDQYTSFQGHFPVIHMPTFRIGDAFEGLLLGMICVGAVYSDRVSATQVRDMMELAKSVIERNSPIFSIVSREQTGETGYGAEAIGSTKSDLEQITAIFMMQVLFTWHGTPVQREKARQQFPLVVDLARRAGLTKPMTTAPFSVLHQPHVTVENFNVASFDWNAWVEQEKRSRLMFILYLLDASMVSFFNIPPRFEKDEIRLPLPADDAAWDARSAAECAEALGLHGPLVARSKNPGGSRRPKQPEMHSALNTLLQNNWDISPGMTNLYSKFILIHALHVQLWLAHKSISMQEPSQQALAFPSSGTSTPVSQHDWVKGIEPSTSTTHSANNSGRATPVDQASSQPLRTINNAFDKWKKSWDEDMTAQHPPSASHYHRFGFCRDAVHFYWLAKYLMKQTRPLEWQMAPDQRFTQVMSILKFVKSWVVSDSAKRGEELGSVSDVDKDYGLTDLTLDMKMLFKPINKQLDSPVSGVQTNIGGAME